MLVRWFSILLVATPLISQGAAKLKVAIALNEDSNSSSTSNAIENHIGNGVRLALSEYPKEAAQIDTTFLNHGESAQKTLDAIQKINEIKPEFVIGMGNSFQALLCAKHLSSDTILISPVATSDEILEKGKNIFLFSNVNSIQAKLLANILKKKVKANAKVLLVEVEGCPYCKNMASQMSTEMKSLGIKFETRQFHLANIKSLKENSESENFDHIILPVHEEESAQLVDFFHNKNKNATFWGGDGWGPLARYIKRLPYSDKVKAFWLAHYHVDIATPVNKAFVAAYRKKYAIDPVDTSAFYYEAMKTLLKNGGKSKGVAAISGSGTFEGVTGTVKLHDRYVTRPMPLLKLQQGKVEIAEVLNPKGAQ